MYQPADTLAPTPSPAGPVALSVLVPMFREARRIGLTLADLVPSLRGASESCELLLVDDGSDDDTVRAVQSWITEAPSGALRRVRLVQHGNNRGKGAAVRTGLAATEGRWRLLMDADNACRVTEVSKLQAAAERSGAALVVGSRRAPGAVVDAKFSRQLAGSIFRACLWPLGLALARDTQCGFKLYRADLAQTIARTAQEDRFAFDLEHLLIAKRSRLGIAEVGIRWAHVDGGTVRPIRDGIRMLLRASVIRLRHLGPAPAPEPALASMQIEAKPSVAQPAAERAESAEPMRV